MADVFYQIARYLFELRVNGPHLAAKQVALGLDQVLSAFQVPTIEVPSQLLQSSLEIETKAGVIHCFSGDICHRVEINLDRDIRFNDVIFALDAFEPEIVNQAIRESPGHLWIHGACLQRGEELVMLVAESGTGKTTLSLGLVSQGYQILTDDIILIDLATQQIIPVPRCPKIRSSASEYLQSIGFDLEREAMMIGRYVILPNSHFQNEPVSAAINRVFMLKRTLNVTGSISRVDITSGILGLLNRSNLMGIDSSLIFAHNLFRNTTFLTMNLDRFADDLRAIAGFP
jgi:hypothetical protein